MYKCITPKLFNTITRSVKVKIKVVKPRALSKPRKERRKPKKEEKKPRIEKKKPREEEKKPREERKPRKEIKKPRIEKRKPRIEEKKPKEKEKKLEKEERKLPPAKCPHLRSNKTCARMVKEGLDGSVSDVDIKHFCNGNPLLCYYFRLSQQKEK